jgi:hypothetical protein
MLLVFIIFHVIIATKHPSGHSTNEFKANGVHYQKEYVVKSHHDLEAFKSDIGDHSSGLDELCLGNDLDLLGYKADSSSGGIDEEGYTVSAESDGEDEAGDKGSNN